MSYFRVNEKCNGCLACVRNCPATALSFEDDGEKRTIRHNIILCARCGNCWRVCPEEAIEFQHLMKGGWDDVASLDLVYCQICGKPLYSMKFDDVVSDKLGDRIEPLCDEHKAAQALTGWQRAAASGREPKGVTK